MIRNYEFKLNKVDTRKVGGVSLRCNQGKYKVPFDTVNEAMKMLFEQVGSHLENDEF